MDMSYDAFIYLQDNLPPDSTIFIWRIIYASNDPFVQSIRDKSATSYSGLSQVVVEQFFRTDVVETLRNGNMPLDLWISFLVEYKELLLKNNDQVEQLNPSIKIFLRERFLDRINPVLSCKIKEEEIGKLLEETNFVVKDPLFDLASVGSHKPSVRTVRLSLSTLLGNGAENNTHIMAHEFLHVASTGQVVARTSHTKGLSPYTTTHSQWSGLSAKGFDEEKFTWLNEAVTEVLAAIMVDCEPVTYLSYIKLMNLLLTKGKKQISFETLANAYFEKKGYKAPEEDKHEFWKFLMREIRESYDHDKQFLVKLSLMVEKMGTDSAIEFLETWNPENPSKIDMKSLSEM